MKIIYVPLDERPCNANFVNMIASIQKEIKVLQPSSEILSSKKESADVEKCWKFVLDNSSNCDYAIISIDMLLYGGLLPSRIHSLDRKLIEKRVENIRLLKQNNPKLTIYGFQCIMRCPHYNSSEEEPDYYEEYGEALFNRAWLMNKKERLGLTKEEEEKLKLIDIPLAIIEDYEYRRNFNLDFNLIVTDLVKEGIINTLVIPQDDSSEFGYTAIAQKRVIEKVNLDNLGDSVHVYPGADEVGCSLLARAWNHFHNRELRVYPFYCSTLGHSITPLYEDRPLAESLKKHINIIGGYIVNDVSECDYAIGINSCGKVMQESFDQFTKRDITYSSYRDVKLFVKQTIRYINKGIPVAICDSAYSNGSDFELIKELDDKDVFHQLCGYAGWNTNCNSLGTVLSMATLGFEIRNEELHKNLMYRLLEDAYYQAVVRQEIIADYLPRNNMSYYDFKGRQLDVENEIKTRIQAYYDSTRLSKQYPVVIKNIKTPWKRMFEIEIVI